MSTSVELQSPGWAPPPPEPLNEAIWQAWLAKGRAQSRRDKTAFLKAVKWVPVAALLVVAAGLLSQLTPYHVVVRFIVAAGAMAVMVRAFQTRNYLEAVMFGALAVLYNPVAPVFSFSGGWQRGLVAASAVPFIVSLARREDGAK